MQARDPKLSQSNAQSENQRLVKTTASACAFVRVDAHTDCNMLLRILNLEMSDFLLCRLCY